MLARVDHSPSRAGSGFTLLEVLLALAVLAVLVAGLAGISSTALRLGQRVVEAQQEEAVRDSFERILRENLSEIAPDSPVRLAMNDSGGGQSLVLGNAAGIFPVTDLPLVMDSVALESKRDRSGRLALSLVFYAGDYWQAMQDNAFEQDLTVSLPLRSGFEKLEWQVYDSVNEEWLTEWDESGRRPHYLALVYRFTGDPADSRMVVWLPRLQTAIAGAGGRGGGGGGGGGGGRDGGGRDGGGRDGGGRDGGGRDGGRDGGRGGVPGIDIRPGAGGRGGGGR